MDYSDLRKSPSLIKNYKVLHKIGEGTYGEVVLAVKNNEPNSEQRAIKIVKNKEVEKNKLSSVQNERFVLEKCKGYPFIVEMKEFFKDKFGSFYVLEYLPGGELYEIIQKKGFLSEDAARFYASQALLAIEYMHSLDIIYRDLKPENVLLDSNGYIKLADFGLSELDVTSPTLTKVCGTPEYVCPDMLFQSGYGKEVDHWSIGIFIFEMITGHTPFQGKNQEEIFEKIKFSEVSYPINISPSLKNLLEGLFMKSPSKRLGSKGIDQIKKHPWFAKSNWEGLRKKLIKPPFKNLVNENRIPHLENNSSNESPSEKGSKKDGSPTLSLDDSF